MHGVPCLAFLFSDAGIDEWALLGVIAFILFGPKKLPEIARSVGRLMARLRRHTDAFREQISQLDQPAADPHTALHAELDGHVPAAAPQAPAQPDPPQATATAPAQDRKADHGAA